MKNFLDNYKSFQKNRKLVGFSKLGFWIAFFVVIILIANLSSGTTTSKTSKDDVIEDNNEIKSYHFEYNFNDQKYNGTYDAGNIEIILEDYAIYINGNKIYSNKEGVVIPDYTYSDLNKVNKIISDKEPDFETNYKDGKKEASYVVLEDDKEITIDYIKNTDNTYLVTADDLNNHLEIRYFDIGKATLDFDSSIYIYELTEEELNEY